jgi:hypothetical protein
MRDAKPKTAASLKISLAMSADRGRKAGAVRLALSTEAANTNAQSLYENMGWKRDTAFYAYRLAFLCNQPFKKTWTNTSQACLNPPAALWISFAPPFDPSSRPRLLRTSATAFRRSITKDRFRICRVSKPLQSFPDERDPHSGLQGRVEEFPDLQGDHPASRWTHRRLRLSSRSW